MHKELKRSGFYYGFPVLLATTKDQKGRDDTEHPPSGTQMRLICMPFRWLQPPKFSPTTSAKPATSRTPFAIASMRASVSRKRSSNAKLRHDFSPFARSLAFATFIAYFCASSSSATAFKISNLALLSSLKSSPQTAFAHLHISKISFIFAP